MVHSHSRWCILKSGVRRSFMLKGTPGGLSPTSSSGQGQHWLQSQLLSALSSWEVFTPRTVIAKPLWLTCSTACLASSWFFFASSSWPSWQPFTGLIPVFQHLYIPDFQHLYCAVGPKTGHSITDAVRWVLSKGELSLPLICRTLKIAYGVVSRQHCQGAVLANVQPTGYQDPGSVSAELAPMLYFSSWLACPISICPCWISSSLSRSLW